MGDYRYQRHCFPMRLQCGSKVQLSKETSWQLANWFCGPMQLVFLNDFLSISVDVWTTDSPIYAHNEVSDVNSSVFGFLPKEIDSYSFVEFFIQITEHILKEISIASDSWLAFQRTKVITYTPIRKIIQF